MKVAHASNNELNDMQFNGLLAQYNTLRSEILKRIELRNSIMFGTLTFSGVLIGFGLSIPSLALIYIVISMFLAIAWIHSDVMVSQLGRYIREQIEHYVPGLNWETDLHQKREIAAKTKKFRPNIVFSAGGIFLITQGLALIIALSKILNFTFLEWFLVGVAILCILRTFILFTNSDKPESQ